MRSLIACIIIIGIVSIAIHLGVKTQVHAQVVSQPTLYCLGSCPTLAPSPQTRQPQRGIAPAVEPTTTEPSPLPTATTPSASPSSPITPCEAETVNVQTRGKKKHKKRQNGAIGNGMNALLRFFIEFINLLLRLIGGGTLPAPTPVPTNPCNPTPSTEPTQPVPSEISVTPSLTQAPTTTPTPSSNLQGTAGCGKAVASGTTKKTITVNSVQRTYLVVVPTGFDNTKPAPLIFGFHGGSDTAENANAYMGLTNSGQILYVYPQAPYWPEAGGIGWNVDPAGVDFPYFDSMLTEIKNTYCIDTPRVFATGKSNGGFFVNALACHRPGVLSGIASVAGGGPATQCANRQPVAAMFVHGKADQTVPLDTGTASRDYWLGVNGYTSGTPTSTTPSQCVSYPGTSKPTLWCEHAGGHDWPAWAGAGIKNFFLQSGVSPTPLSTTTEIFPGETNTGYKNAVGYPGKLTTFTGTIESNKTYKFVDFPNGLYIPQGITNVTFYGCRFTSNETVSANVFVLGDNITFDYCSFEPKPNLASAPPVPYTKGYQYGIAQRAAGKVTVDHSDFWGWGNGIEISSSSQAKPFTVKNSWFHDAREDGGVDHTDAILENWGESSYIVIEHNTIVSKGNTNGLALQGPSYKNIRVTNNYFSGFGATVALGTKATNTNLVFTDNVFGTDIQPFYRPAYGWFGNTWKRNKIHFVPGSKVYLDGEHKTDLITAADEGKYWLPNNTISSTDYTGQ